jgi:hypothetical protein
MQENNIELVTGMYLPDCRLIGSLLAGSFARYDTDILDVNILFYFEVIYLALSDF